MRIREFVEQFTQKTPVANGRPPMVPVSANTAGSSEVDDTGKVYFRECVEPAAIGTPYAKEALTV